MPDGSVNLNYYEGAAKRQAAKATQAEALAARVERARVRARVLLEQAHAERAPPIHDPAYALYIASREAWIERKLAQVERKTTREFKRDVERTARRRDRSAESQTYSTRLAEARDELDRMITRHHRVVAKVREQERSGWLAPGDAKRAMREEARTWKDTQRTRYQLRSRINYLARCAAREYEG